MFRAKYQHKIKIRAPIVVIGEVFSPGWKCNRIFRKFPALAFL